MTTLPDDPNVLAALKEIVEAAKLPKQWPPGATEDAIDPMTAGDLAEYRQTLGPPKAQPWRERLTPAQETLCRWIWDTCARHHMPFEQFEAGFLFDYNVNHELRTWARIALCFREFAARHPSADKQDVVESLVILSTGSTPHLLRGGRAKELNRMWKEADF